MTDLLTPSDLAPMILSAIDAHPDALNPTSLIDGMTCLYTDPDDPARHCVIGQVASDAGWEVPDSSVEADAHNVAEGFHWPVTRQGARYLTAVQEVVDLASVDDRPWVTVRSDVANVINRYQETA